MWSGRRALGGWGAGIRGRTGGRAGPSTLCIGASRTLRAATRAVCGGGRAGDVAIDGVMAVRAGRARRRRREEIDGYPWKAVDDVDEDAMDIYDEFGRVINCSME